MEASAGFSTSKSPGSITHEISNYSGGLSIGGEVDWKPGLNSENQKSETFLLSKLHPVMLWQNRGYS